MPDQYTRTRAQLGTPALDVLRRAHVAVFGIGGVGGQAVEVLARSGVGELSLFDSDTVALSNLNRQLVALHSTLGQYKVDVVPRFADIDRAGGIDVEKCDGLTACLLIENGRQRGKELVILRAGQVLFSDQRAVELEPFDSSERA